MILQALQNKLFALPANVFFESWRLSGFIRSNRKDARTQRRGVFSEQPLMRPGPAWFRTSLSCAGGAPIAHEKQIKAATDFTDYTDFMDDSNPEGQQSVKSVKSVAAFKNRRVIFGRVQRRRAFPDMAAVGRTDFDTGNQALIAIPAANIADWYQARNSVRGCWACPGVAGSRHPGPRPGMQRTIWQSLS